MQFEVYGCDTETTGTNPNQNDPIEICFYQLSTDRSKTWCLKPINQNNIEPDALRINGHKMDDLLWKTSEGRVKYCKAEEVIVEMENWLAEDGVPASNRILLGHNVKFDYDMLTSLWSKCHSSETFPFDKYTIDTMGLEFALDYALGKFGEGYSLRNLSKVHKVKNEKSHTAEADTKTTVEIFRHQINRLKTLLENENPVCSK
jgi:DNA polymerase III epsilon subunit-like protein